MKEAIAQLQAVVALAENTPHLLNKSNFK